MMNFVVDVYTSCTECNYCKITKHIGGYREYNCTRGKKGKKHHRFIVFENKDVASIPIPDWCCKLSRNAKNIEVKNR